MRLMGLAKRLELVPESEYLARELTASTKSEYLSGVVFALAGSRVRHNRIASNMLVALGRRLSGPCEPFNSDMKIRVRLPGHVRYYYPDVSVVCVSNPASDPFQDQPTLVIEVLSTGTRRVDEGEKKDAYLSLPSLAAYVLIEQEGPAMIVHRRQPDGFRREIYEGLEACVPLLELELPLSEIYRGVEFGPEPEDQVQV